MQDFFKLRTQIHAKQVVEAVKWTKDQGFVGTQDIPKKNAMNIIKKLDLKKSDAFMSQGSKEWEREGFFTDDDILILTLYQGKYSIAIGRDKGGKIKKLVSSLL